MKSARRLFMQPSRDERQAPASAWVLETHHLALYYTALYLHRICIVFPLVLALHCICIALRIINTDRHRPTMITTSVQPDVAARTLLCTSTAYYKYTARAVVGVTLLGNARVSYCRGEIFFDIEKPWMHAWMLGIQALGNRTQR